MNGAPLFVVGAHDDRLAERLSHLPAHALTAIEASGALSIEPRAARLIEVLERRQPLGPYRLLGRGLAGLVAYEMACQLAGRDAVVDFIGLVDCPRPRNLPVGRMHEDTVEAVCERYCPQALPIPVHLFSSHEPATPESAHDWAGLLGQWLRLIVLADVPEDVAITKAFRSATGPARSPLASAPAGGFAHLMTLQEASCDAPCLFLVPGAGASVTSFMPLAACLGPEPRVYGLQPRGLSGGLVPHCTVESAAAAYCREIRVARPHGPYFLAGHSFGGWIALEMANQLTAAGETVANPLVVIDSDAPFSSGVEPVHCARVEALVKLIALLEELSDRDMYVSRAQLEMLDYEMQLSKLKQGMLALGLLPRTSSLAAIRDLVRVFERNLNTHYAPRVRFPGRVLLIQAADPPLRRQPDDRQASEICEAWREQVAHLECVSMKGRHMTLLKKPHVEAIAHTIWKRWRPVRAVPGLNVTTGRWDMPTAEGGRP